VLHDNTTNRTAVPASLPAALARAKQWIGRRDSVDLGLMQIDSANLTRHGNHALIDRRRAAYLDPLAVRENARGMEVIGGLATAAREAGHDFSTQ